MQNVLLSTAYLGPVQYYSKMAKAQKVIVEQYDHYKKQTFRNRCTILGGNGPYDLIIPIVKNSGVKTLLKDVQIEYTTPWQDKHWRTIVSAYNSSPFFEYYRDDFQPFFEKEWKYLFEFNMALNEVIVENLELDAECIASADYETNFDGPDFRSIILPRKENEDLSFQAKPYTQTFHERFGFVPNLSIIDLLFNAGPESLSVLEGSFTDL